MYYFIGIKGSGMASLACMLSDIGKQVSGSDITKHIFTEDQLVARNIPIYQFNEIQLQDNWTVVVGNAFLDSFEEVIAARSNPTITVIRYHDFLGEFIKSYTSVAVSGSHGKTTTTSMLASMFTKTKKAGYLIGDGVGKLAANDDLLVIEACEYRRHFLSYYPDYAIITNVDIDHIDYFSDDQDYQLAFEQFISNVKKAVVICGEDHKAKQLKPAIPTIWYGFDENFDLVAKDVVTYSHQVEFNCIYHQKDLGRVRLPFVGEHMILNSLASIGVGLLLNMSLDEIIDGLSTFSGAKRRFVIEEGKKNIYIDDYAHHPTEVEMTIKAAKTRFPDKKIVAIFKPHRVSRLYRFNEAFASALSLADHVGLCDFNAIDDFEEGYDIDIRYLQEKIDHSFIVSEDKKGAQILSTFAPAVYLFMSSKDIYVLADHLKQLEESK